MATATPAAPAAKSKKPAAPQVQLVMMSPDDLVVEDGFNPRQLVDADQEKFANLTASIGRRGVLNPLVAVAKGRGKPKLLGGHRRHAAAVAAGAAEIPVIVRSSEDDELIAAILDNSHREDLTPLEEALAYGRLKSQGLTVKGIADELSVAQKRVTERLRILELPPNAQAALGDGKLGLQHVARVADLAGIHMGLAQELVDHTLRDGRPAWDNQNAILKAATAVKLIDPFKIEMASWHFKATSPTLRDLHADMRRYGNSYGAEANAFRAALLRAKVLPYSYSTELCLPDQVVKEGIATRTIIEVPLKDHRGDVLVALCVDQAWLQDQLQPILEKVYPKAVAAAAKAATAAGKPVTAGNHDEAAKEQRRQEREAKQAKRDEAKAFNAKLGPALLNHFATVPIDLTLIKWLCSGLLYEQPTGYSPTVSYTVGELAADGMRFIMPEWHKEVTTRGGKTKIELPTDKKELAELFWAWWELAETAEEVAGRTLIAFAAARYARRDAAMSKEEVYTHGRGKSRANTFEKLLEHMVSGKVPGTAKRPGNTTSVDVARPLVDVFADRDAAEANKLEPNVEQIAAELTANEKKVLLARTDPKWQHGGDAKPLAGLFALCKGITQKDVTLTCGALVRRRLLDPPQTGGYIVTTLGELVAKRLRAPKGTDAAIKKRAEKAQEAWVNEGVMTPAGRAAIEHVKLLEGEKAVLVLPTREEGAGAFPRVARLSPAKHPENPDGVVKVIYPTSAGGGTAVWVAKHRIVEDLTAEAA